MKLLALHEIEHSHGTVQLISDGQQLQHKKGTSIVLVPQPTGDDPNDPLNWPFEKRVAAYWSVLWLSALCHFCITGLAPGFGQLIEEFEISLTGSIRDPVRQTTSLAYLWPLLLGGTSEPLSVGTLHDILFLHERGTQSGVQAIWLSLGSSLAPPICGFLIQDRGWRLYHRLVSIMAGADLILRFFLVPDTQYKRDLNSALDAAGVEENDDMADGQTESHCEMVESKTGSQAIERLEPQRSAVPGIKPKKAYLEGLKPWSQVHKDVNLLGSFIRPWATWCYASVVWSVLSFSIHVTCVVVLINLNPVYLGALPYNFSTSQQGLVFLSPCLGNLFGSFFCGYVNDKLSQWSTRRNGGVFEPEMRLPVVAIPVLLVPAGLLMFGIGVAHETHWIVPVIGAGLVGVALTGIGSVIQPYLMDSYAPIIFDCRVTFNGFKNLVSFAVGFAVVPWLELDGVVAVFVILAVLVVVIDASALRIYLFGKKLRQRDTRLRIFLFLNEAFPGRCNACSGNFCTPTEEPALGKMSSYLEIEAAVFC
ncbi:uncharacterized protein Z519_09501 [Cladophialophora bantiana CBS 173.52]|uniref:Major facilitator superfamily (MFS) profile domain-containing protein n=1 Tax=Cladophialophora bantiana (strain ATCC 10958 / CBS 173.52 / CDC B-1940 / NIH 8579) TaxID=1442370 RepID=A0A0D2HH38_CLAB1|nr:uncharacterized protein Z519_09501 [Cladophialophora bantiana CBS 173.52]KIW90070.1 hypothetical protein Z519_09501 [Cladophialophora bantiana CBS 173.52]